MENKSKLNLKPIIISALIGAIIGFIASQYFPLFGGIMANLGRPFSQARLSLASGHIFLFLGIGLVVGFLYQKNKSNSKN